MSDETEVRGPMMERRYWPTTQPRLADGTVDVRAYVAALDAYWNVGAGKPRP